MKNTVIVIVLGLVTIVGACWTFVNVREQKTQALELATQKAEAEQRKETAKQKVSENERRKAEMQKSAAEKKAKAAADERATAEAKAKTAADEKAKAADERAKAEAEAKRAAAEKAAAEARATEELAKQKAVEQRLMIVMATNETRQAELDIAMNARLQAQAVQRAQQAEAEALKLKKLELDKRLAETAALEETLRQREEATRPERTIKDIMDANERRRAEEEAAAAEAEEKRLAELREKDYAAYEAEMEKRRKINREGVAGPAAKELTDAEKALKRAVDERDRTTAEGRAALRKRLIARLEPDLRSAIRDGRKIEAEHLLAALLSLVPDYKITADAKPAAEAEKGSEQ